MRNILLISLFAMAYAEDRPIHPLALKQIKCWLSDTEEPVVTQFSITAVNINRNQFDYSNVTVKNNVVEWTDGAKICSYTMIAMENGIKRFVLLYNGGGSLTERDIIDGKIIDKVVNVNGDKKTIEVLDVVAINPKGLTSR
jgi:hypothetical protein